MASIEEQILAQIKNNEEGTIFLTEDFAQIAIANELRVALYRLVKRGVLCRLASGIYVKPIWNLTKCLVPWPTEPKE
ncbi:DUF6088 family protein [Flagellimonas okinawensis]|uniref:DUF6088 family protein n=1 Tax=Flagellimonas okinawensis TaxID=3031324 RepID=UPI003AB02A88